MQLMAEEAITQMRGPLRYGKDRSGKKGHKRRMTHLRNAAFLWLYYKGWQPEVIGDTLDCSRAAVYRFREMLGNSPWIIFYFPVLSRGSKGTAVVWTCEVCGDKLLKYSEKRAREHVALHFLPRAIITHRGVYEGWYA